MCTWVGSGLVCGNTPLLLDVVVGYHPLQSVVSPCLVPVWVLRRTHDDQGLPPLEQQVLDGGRGKDDRMDGGRERQLVFQAKHVDTLDFAFFK